MVEHLTRSDYEEF